MIQIRWFTAIVLAMFLITNLVVIDANPLQHLSNIDLSQIDVISDKSNQDLSTDLERALQYDSEIGNIEAPTARSITSDQLKPIVSGVLSSLETSLGPLLGPLAPLSSIISPLITSAVTELLAGVINALLNAATNNALGQINGYDSYVIDIPNQGSYLLLSKQAQFQSEPGNLVQSLQSNAGEKLVVNALNNILDNPPIHHVASVPVANTFLDNLTAARPYTPEYKSQRKPNYAMRRQTKKKPSFLIPFNLVQAANGNLNTFAKSRSTSPLTDYEIGPNY